MVLVLESYPKSILLNVQHTYKKAITPTKFYVSVDLQT